MLQNTNLYYMYKDCISDGNRMGYLAAQLVSVTTYWMNKDLWYWQDSTRAMA